MIPPKANADFVAHMEDVLDVYKRPYDPSRPVVCMDEQPTQLIKETRRPLPAAPGRPERADYEYERAGTAENFLFTEPLGGWRKVNVRDRRTSVDWAQEMREMLEEDYPDAEAVVLVCDNLNTHKAASLYEAFEPAEAQRMSDQAVGILRAIDAGELPPRIAQAADFFLCRFCPYAVRCWEAPA